MSATPMPMPAPARPSASPIQPGTSSLNGTTMTNRTTLAQLREMDAAQAARLPVDHLALLLEEV
jgi:TorA maturation chaperone TorD